MAIAFGAGIGEVHTGATTLTTSASVPSGGTVIFNVYWYGSVTLSSVSGGSLTWAVDKQQSGGADTNYRVAVCSAYASSGMSSSTVITPTFSGTPTARQGLSAYYITGAATSTPVDVTAGATYSSIGSSGSASITTTNADDLIAYAMWVDLITTDITPATNFNEVYDAANTGESTELESGYRVVAATSTYSPGGSWTGTKPWVVAAVAYKAAAGTTVADNTVRRRPKLIFRGFR